MKFVTQITLYVQIFKGAISFIYEGAISCITVLVKEQSAHLVDYPPCRRAHSSQYRRPSPHYPALQTAQLRWYPTFRRRNGQGKRLLRHLFAGILTAEEFGVNDGLNTPPCLILNHDI